MSATMECVFRSDVCEAIKRKVAANGIVDIDDVFVNRDVGERVIKDLLSVEMERYITKLYTYIYRSKQPHWTKKTDKIIVKTMMELAPPINIADKIGYRP